jgi:hypothetical protein
LLFHDVDVQRYESLVKQQNYTRKRLFK